MNSGTILNDPRVLRFVVAMIAAAHVMMGSDLPLPISLDEPSR